MSDPNTGSLCFSIHVEGLKLPEVMQSIRRIMLRPFLLLWLAVYTIDAVYMLISRNVTFFTLYGPAIILILLGLSYEFSCRKQYKPLKYDEAVMDYTFTPKGFTLSIGDQSAQFDWENVRMVKTRSDYLLYTDKRNSSVLPKRCISPEQAEKLLSWANAK
ncbi:MAG: YcxB family protein [Oscillospiraceae bacterium]|nr:YcxB family protein [Oscillospiraceae bacterium]